ncbi:MAG: GNAT family N-acetyltransferase [Eubacterium sp.]|nr:GNAT family N-acetyltransferase [Eubacterium sp.]MDE6156130.1 GNAT family N-acetyltransferase [Eubacterium sp.]MDE6767145.1 GNAT family N-acetyltransferase [Eubacterium sp.]
MEIRYAAMEDKNLLLSEDGHIKEEILKEIIKDKREIIMLVDGHFAGWIRYNLFWDEIPFMNMLYLLEAYRGKGYGTQLVKFWENEMRKLGYDRLMTSTQANECAQHFYRKLGYQDAGSFFPFCNDLEIIFTKEL